MDKRFSGRGRARSRLGVPVAVVALLLLMTVLPSISFAAPPLAQETPEAEDENAELDQEDDQTDDQSITSQPNGTAAITVTKYECLADYIGNKSNFLSYCFPPSSPIEFQVYGPNFTEFYEDSFSEVGLEPGFFSIQESLPQGWYPVVFCQKSTSALTDGGDQQVVIYDGYYELDVLAGEYLYCDWFNIPPLRSDLIINKHYCPAASDEFDAYDADIFELAEECQEEGPPVDFTLSQGATEIGTETAEGDPPLATFSQFTPGESTITEEHPAGYGEPIVYCGANDTLGNDIAGAAPAPYENGHITWLIGNGHAVFCDWYNVPGGEGGSISILKITCPETFAPSGGSYDYYIEECTEPTEGIPFKLDGDSSGNPGSQETDADGQITWNEREADTYYITEEEPEDGPLPYGIPVVYCSYYDPAALQDREWEEYPLDDEGRITFDLDEDEYIACVWFNIYDDEYGSVTVYKYTCPETFVPQSGGSYDYYLSECPEATADIPFKLDGASTGNPGSQPTDQDGKVVWNEREEDTYYLTEEEPEDGPLPYGRPMVFCAYVLPEGGDPAWEQYETDDEGRIQFDLGDQEDIVCYWFNLYDDEYGSITIYKYTCPDEFGYGEGSYEYYLSECDDPTADVPFKLDGASTGNPGSQPTDQDGKVVWNEREADTYVVTEEEVPSGYGRPIVYCAYTVQDPVWEEYTPDDEYQIEFELADQQHIVCYWFNIYADEYGSITIYKYTCPEEFGYGEGSYEYYLTECPEATADIPFKLDSDSTGNPGSQPTDQDGKVVWGEREADTYYVTEEEVPSGYGRPVVYCAYTVQDPVWEEYTPDTAYQISFALADQQHIVCYWFNIYDDEYGSITVVKVTCPEAEGYGGGSYHWYADRCDEYTADVSFKLESDSTGNPGSQTTDANGLVYWDEREADTYYITEEDPEDGESPYGRPAVYCYYYVPGSDIEWEQYETDDLERIEFELGDRQDIVCVWFNLYKGSPLASPPPSSSPQPSPSPSPTGGPGTGGPGVGGGGTGGTGGAGGAGQPNQTGPATLIIQKYDCDEGYEWRDDEADPEEDCAEPADGIVFELAVEGDSPSQAPRQAETGEDEPGEATFTGVTAGDYRLTELDLEEGYVAFILTCESSRRDFEDYPYYPFALATSDGTVYLTLVAAETLTCTWYNVPPEPEEEENGENGESGVPEEEQDEEDAEDTGLLLQVYSCDGDEQSEDACDPQTDPASYALIPVSGGDPETLETDATGTGRIEGLDGVYTLVQIGAPPCVVESADVDAQGNLSLDPDKGTLVKVFNCA